MNENGHTRSRHEGVLNGIIEATKGTKHDDKRYEPSKPTKIHSNREDKTAYTLRHKGKKYSKHKPQIKVDAMNANHPKEESAKRLVA